MTYWQTVKKKADENTIKNPQHCGFTYFMWVDECCLTPPQL